MGWSVRRYRLTREVALPRAKVWELLSDTDHLNRVIGLFAVAASPAQATGGELFRVMDARVWGIVPVRWREYPFDWLKEERYTVLREYERGPLVRMYSGVALADGAPGHTRLTLFADFTPRSLAGVIAARFEGYGRMRRTLQYVESYVRLARAGRPDLRPQVRERFEANEPELDRVLGELARRRVDQAWLPHLREHLLTQGDDEVTGMQPFALAVRWDADRTEILRLFLHGARVGLLNLSWNLICPNCRVETSQTDSLASLHTAYHCDFCGAGYQADFDRYVELRFDVHPAVRRATRSVYCVGGPGLTPHILLQRYIRQGQAEELPFPPGAEELRLRVLRHGHTVSFGGAGRAETVYTDRGFHEDTLARPEAGAPLRIENRSSQDMVAVVERLEWDPLAATAARVTAMQEFRDLFSSEVLAPGQEVGVASVTILFSDLAGSTAMYEQVGDAPAYGKVRRHFDYMTGHIAGNDGALVKTIGDAVMAVFSTPADGVRAALEIQRHLGEFNASLPAGTAPVIIKIGLHHGPAIAINANDLLDYFGRTVNIAARVQRESRGGDVLITEACYGRPDVAAVLAEYSAVAERYGASLKGIEGQVAVARVLVAR